jgi:hypothetical protein
MHNHLIGRHHPSKNSNITQEQFNLWYIEVEKRPMALPTEVGVSSKQCPLVFFPAKCSSTAKKGTIKHAR